MRNLLNAGILCVMCGLALFGQDNPLESPQEPPAAQPAQQKPPDTQPPAGAPVDPSAATSPLDKRVFGVIPNNRTTSGAVPFEPITAKQKIVIGLKDSFDWPPYLTGAAFAGLYQVENSNPSFGQGVAGYFHRWATASADQVIGNLMTEAFVPAAFHQDPRYFLLGPGNGTKKHRLWHAVSSILVTKMDSGRMAFNFSEWGGNALATAISNAYYPDGRSASSNVDRWLVAVGTDTFSNVLKEFWPDVKNWWKRKLGTADSATTIAH
jgi:hypothetical protein